MKKWWMEHKFRMIQNNLRDIDGSMDVEYEVKMLKEFGANVLQIGCGGISSFVDEDMDFQIKSPYLKPDQFGRMVKACKENGIRVIARFDVSKVHESLAKKHPEWMTRRADGSMVYFNGTVATCLNGEYQQVKTMELIRTVLKKYPVDAIFFNMFGYQTRDYDGKYVGICQCESCRQRFRDMYGAELPKEENEQDPVYQLYKEFQKKTVTYILKKIRQTIDEINPNIALSTYSHYNVDIIRNESNSAVDRPYPFWIYSASDNTATVNGTFRNKVASNCAINAVDIPYRFMGVSDELNRIRLYEDMANGSNLDWCIIGSFEDYPDRSNYEGVKEIFHYQERYQKYFDALASDAKVLLLQPKAPYEWLYSSEYRGIFRMLKEAHIRFDVALASELDECAKRLKQYELIILPEITSLESQSFIRKLKESKAVILATGISLQEDPILLKDVFGQKLLERVEQVRGSYFQTTPKMVFQSMKDQDWIYLDKEFYLTEGEGEKILPFVSPSTYGPPERCFGHKLTAIPGAVIYQKRHIYLPWKPGTLYYQHGYEAFKKIILDLISYEGIQDESFETDAHPSVEVFYNPCGDGKYLLQMINLSGFNGTTVGKPVIQRDITVTWKAEKPISVTELKPDGEAKQNSSDVLRIPELNRYCAYLIEF